MSIQRITDATLEPVTLGELREHLRLSGTEEDAVLTLYLKAARQQAEVYTRRAFLEQEWELRLDAFPCQRPWPTVADPFAGRLIEIERTPVLSVDAVKYTDEAGAEQTLDPETYDVDLQSLLPRIVLRPDQSWPATACMPGAVVVEFTAGYGATRADVPETLRLAVLHLASHFFENRVPVNIGNIVNPLPFHVEALLNGERVMGGALAR